MMRAMLAVFVSGLVTADLRIPSGCCPGRGAGLIRNGFVVHRGKMLLVDDMSVDCVIAAHNS